MSSGPARGLALSRLVAGRWQQAEIVGPGVVAQRPWSRPEIALGQLHPSCGRIDQGQSGPVGRRFNGAGLGLEPLDVDRTILRGDGVETDTRREGRSARTADAGVAERIAGVYARCGIPVGCTEADLV